MKITEDLANNVNGEKKLMKKITILIISFLIISVIDIILFIVLQSHELFMFKLNRQPENISNYGTYKFVSYILVGLIILFLISYIKLIIATINRKRNKIESDKLTKSYSFFDFFTVIPIFFLVIMIVNGFFFSLAVVDGESMMDSFCSNDIVLINYNSEIDKDDVIVFKKDKIYIKRVIGVPGDHLEIIDNNIYINDIYIEQIEGSFIYDDYIEQGNYFVLGDNRDNSTDSRIFGFVDNNEIIGEVISNLSNANCELN
ncbi:MAG: signal peptidase I [Bacillota bacterium]